MKRAEAMSDEAAVQLRLGYLGMLQDVIARLSGFSATIKTAAIAVFAALLALDVGGVVRAVSVPVILGMFGFLDAYYISRERAFRTLYESAARSPFIGLQDLSMESATNADGNLIRSLASVAVLGFYVPLICVAAGVLLAVELAPQAEQCKPCAPRSTPAAGPAPAPTPALPN